MSPSTQETRELLASDLVPGQSPHTSAAGAAFQSTSRSIIAGAANTSVNDILAGAEKGLGQKMGCIPEMTTRTAAVQTPSGLAPETAFLSMVPLSPLGRAW